MMAFHFPGYRNDNSEASRVKSRPANSRDDPKSELMRATGLCAMRSVTTPLRKLTAVSGTAIHRIFDIHVNETSAITSLFNHQFSDKLFSVNSAKQEKTFAEFILVRKSKRTAIAGLRFEGLGKATAVIKCLC